MTAEFEKVTRPGRFLHQKLLAFLYVSIQDGRILRVAKLPEPMRLPDTLDVMDFRRFLFNPANETVILLNGKDSKTFRLGPVRNGKAFASRPRQEPALAGSGITLPERGRIGAEMTFATCVQGAVPGAKYQLRKKAPGMRIEAETSEIAWRVPQIAYGIYAVDVVLVDSSGAERSVASWQVQIDF